MFERFTKQARIVVIRAQEESRGLGHTEVGSEHLLLGLAASPAGGPAVGALARLGITAESCRAAVGGVAGPAGGPGGGLGEDDAEALRSLGIDLDRIRSRAEEAFGPGALDRAAPSDGGRERRRILPFPRRRGRGNSGEGVRTEGHPRFAPRAKKALELSLREAVALKDGHIGAEHLLLGLTRSEDKVLAGVLGALNTDAKAVRAVLLAGLGRAA